MYKEAAKKREERKEEKKKDEGVVDAEYKVEDEGK
jgi:hypothetical protein